jgi:hypothetical protein
MSYEIDHCTWSLAMRRRSMAIADPVDSHEPAASGPAVSLSGAAPSRTGG